MGVTDSGSMPDTRAMIAFPQSSSCVVQQYSIQSYSQSDIALVSSSRHWQSEPDSE